MLDAFPTRASHLSQLASLYWEENAQEFTYQGRCKTTWYNQIVGSNNNVLRYILGMSRRGVIVRNIGVLVKFKVSVPVFGH